MNAYVWTNAITESVAEHAKARRCLREAMVEGLDWDAPNDLLLGNCELFRLLKQAPAEVLASPSLQSLIAAHERFHDTLLRLSFETAANLTERRVDGWLEVLSLELTSRVVELKIELTSCDAL